MVRQYSFDGWKVLLFFLVDDGRMTNNPKKESWQAAHRVGCILQYIWIQETLRKRRNTS